jgi:uncharacterized protein
MLSPDQISHLLYESLNTFIIATLFAIPIFFTLMFTYKIDPFQGKANDSRLNPITGWHVFKGFGLFLFFQMFIIPILFTLFTTASIKSLTVIQAGYLNLSLVLGGSLGVFTAFYSMNSEQKKFVWGESLSPAKDFFLGAKSWFFAYPIAVSVSQLFSIIILLLLHQEGGDQVAVVELKKLLTQPFLLLFTLIAVVCLVPLAEELLFRGFLQNWLKKRVGVKTSIGISSAIFSFFHFSFSQGVANIEVIAALFVLSCFLGFLYEKQSSIWAHFGLHAAFNGISAIMIVIFKVV